jgi:magnesium chelatase family protein
MLAKLRTFSLVGIEAVPVEVEVDVSAGALPKTVLVGLPEAAVKESSHRIERALVNSGFLRPHDRVVINLAPAELPKQAASFDLPIALGMLAGSGQIISEKFGEYAVVGELALDGATRPTKGALSMAIAAAAEQGLRGLVVPSASAAEAAVVEQLDIIAVSSLSQAVAFFTGQIDIEPTPPPSTNGFAPIRNTTSTLPTSAVRRWPNGPSRSPPPAITICSRSGLFRLTGAWSQKLAISRISSVF